MARKSTGNPPWQALAVKLPAPMIDEVRRYAALHGMSISEVIREGLDSTARARPAPIVVDEAMLEERKRLLEKFLTGEWSVEFEGFEEESVRESDPSEP